MTLFAGHSEHKCKEFQKEIEDGGYAIFSKKKARETGYYPNPFPDFEDIPIGVINEDDIVVIRAFFNTGEGVNLKIESGMIEVQVETVEDDKIWANITTELPKDFPLQKETTIELYIDEIIEFGS